MSLTRCSSRVTGHHIITSQVTCAGYLPVTGLPPAVGRPLAPAHAAQWFDPPPHTLRNGLRTWLLSTPQVIASSSRSRPDGCAGCVSWGAPAPLRRAPVPSIPQRVPCAMHLLCTDNGVLCAQRPVDSLPRHVPNTLPSRSSRRPRPPEPARSPRARVFATVKPADKVLSSA